MAEGTTDRSKKSLGAESESFGDVADEHAPPKPDMKADFVPEHVPSSLEEKKIPMDEGEDEIHEVHDGPLSPD